MDDPKIPLSPSLNILPPHLPTYTYCTLLPSNSLFILQSQALLANMRLKRCPIFISPHHPRPSRLFRNTSGRSVELSREHRSNPPRSGTEMHVSFATSAVRCEIRHPKPSSKTGGILSSFLHFPSRRQINWYISVPKNQTNVMNLTSSFEKFLSPLGYSAGLTAIVLLAASLARMP